MSEAQVNGSAGNQWLILSTALPPRGEEILLVDALRRSGARLVEREGERVVAHIPAPAHPEELLRDVKAAIRAATSLADPELSWRWGTGEALASRWAREVKPRRITERMVVVPAGAEGDLARSGDVVVRVTPGGAFGTAEHPTTRCCLSLMERLVEPGARVADVGAGSGILSIAAALLGAGRVLALEADPGACAEARGNVALNGVSGSVDVRQVEVRPRDLRRLGRFELVVANLQPDALRPLLPGFGRTLAPGARLVLSGVPRGDLGLVLAHLQAAGLEPLDETVEDGWWTACVRSRGRPAPGNRRPS